MENNEYLNLVKKVTPKEKRLKNSIYAFLFGGVLGILCLITYKILNIYINQQDSVIWTIIILILVSSLLTSLGFFDRVVKEAGCGLIVPTSGFAHSVTSSALDYKRDGLITGLGSNLFKLAGSVIIYGIISSFFLALLKVIING